MSKCHIYGPDPEVAEKQAIEIAKSGLKIMKGDRDTDEAEKSDGPDTSRNGLERLK